MANVKGMRLQPAMPAPLSLFAGVPANAKDASAFAVASAVSG
ncbi:hypothetical protein QO199_24605 [Serratia bockelmannii]|uniref:Uncharacterized protein n=1 Tax=Serratia bockelmannii TaxID=2703793 RepID=A0ABT8LWZ1_9GAMM|nr:hypothetical protein [Serratia bockelmannii]MDN6881826.1 hypothetical protein [Serratia bockelmannii]